MDIEIWIEELTLEIMEEIALKKGKAISYFKIFNYPITDNLIEPFCNLPKVESIWIENGNLTDECFKTLSTLPKLKFLGINGHGLSIYKRI